ncbi:hypothetical protein QJ854_gp148 [Moumouvirus goulette]|uniref:Uncharacterized protein n=1 Tax=Moumouvirus goulette TaxID=1247379 RepID=M1PCD6_9VIRU|nr:hypothetical protein QJ854_gp148 [Moumouvirus goulette]AGF85634.1 hypothetical protein glt_00829 [Moumouvirus goulette]
MNLSKYNTNTIYPCEKIIICGKRLSGKTTLANKLIRKICDDRQIQHLYLIVPKKSITQFNIMNHSKLQNKTTWYIDISQSIIEKINSECNKNDGENIIVVDNIFMDSNIIKNLIKIDATIIISRQYIVYNDISSFNTFIMTKEDSILNKKKFIIWRKNHLSNTNICLILIILKIYLITIHPIIMLW